MNIFERFVAEPLQTKRTRRNFAIPADGKQGLTLFEDIMVVRNGDTVTAYDRRCDHNGGKLVSQPGTNIASCPLHGWTFDAESGTYTNVAVRKTPLTVIQTDAGFPLCFTNLEDTEKRRVLTRNRNAMIAGVKNYIEVSKPSVYMPYAGYFAEDPVRDEMVATNNLKNQPSDYLSVCRDSNTILADPTVEDTYVFFGDKLVESYQSEVREVAQPDRNYYAQAWKTFGDISFDEVASYFIGSGFKDNLIAYIGLSDEDFAPQEIYRVDFRATPPSVQLCDEPLLQQIHNETGARVTYARVRTPAFVETIRNLLPWEDLLIGFQARFDRVPNVYDSDFWYHFTNVHIKQRARRAISDCGGSCSRISEAVF